MESHQEWIVEDDRRGVLECDEKLSQQWYAPGTAIGSGALERETLANMKYDGLRDTQSVMSDPKDRQCAHKTGWDDKLLDLDIPHHNPGPYSSLAGATSSYETGTHRNDFLS